MPDVRTRHRSIDVAASHCERLSALSPNLFQTDKLSTYSLSVTGCCLRTNGRFAPEAALGRLKIQLPLDPKADSTWKSRHVLKMPKKRHRAERDCRLRRHFETSSRLRGLHVKVAAPLLGQFGNDYLIRSRRDDAGVILRKINRRRRQSAFHCARRCGTAASIDRPEQLA